MNQWDECLLRDLKRCLGSYLPYCLANDLEKCLDDFLPLLKLENHLVKWKKMEYCCY
jgi:hypothetical protein